MLLESTWVMKHSLRSVHIGLHLLTNIHLVRSFGFLPVFPPPSPLCVDFTNTVTVQSEPWPVNQRQLVILPTYTFSKRKEKKWAGGVVTDVSLNLWGRLNNQQPGFHICLPGPPRCSLSWRFLRRSSLLLPGWRRPCLPLPTRVGAAPAVGINGSQVSGSSLLVAAALVHLSWSPAEIAASRPRFGAQANSLSALVRRWRLAGPACVTSRVSIQPCLWKCLLLT